MNKWKEETITTRNVKLWKEGNLIIVHYVALPWAVFTSASDYKYYYLLIQKVRKMYLGTGV